MGNPDVSVIIETDNLRGADANRAHLMLTELAIQAKEIGRALEVLLVYDDEVVEESFVREAAVRSGLSELANVEVNVHPAQGLRYYEAKNQGVRHADGDIVLFVDSDVIIERGWLAAMLEPFDDPDVSVVAGSTYLGPCTSTIDKTFGLIWIFPLRSPDGPLTPTNHFWANNVAFRREVLDRHPFPGDDGSYRGQCTVLARTLRDEGLVLWRNPAARTMHPAPPRGLDSMIQRALWHGHDRCVASGRNHQRDQSGYAGSSSLRVLGSMLKEPAYRILAGRRQMELSLPAVPLAVAIALAYNVVKWLGFVITRVSPQLLAQRVPRP